MKDARALDVGCAVGATSFKLDETFGYVVGVDYSASFVNKATEVRDLSENSVLTFEVLIQGDISRSHIQAPIPTTQVHEQASFTVGDATKLPALGLG